ncbi:MAG TPA: DUF72 domain-containing protein [Longimicrobium sp.]|uniref:DUF72 domain-containing protein n=1 Tax=Longimicrobium sp. TaxID=2029185 RepID=UPI002ED7E151
MPSPDARPEKPSAAPESIVPGVLIGCAGWSLPREVQDQFPAEGTHLQRYSRVFGVAEINSSFHRPHRPSTYAKWAHSVPEDFRFSAKLPKAITHTQKLVDTDDLLDAFLAEIGGLGEKLACLLVQLPPSLRLNAEVAGAFFAGLRARTAVSVVCEPRHETWFTAEADALLADAGVGRVGADPARVPAAAHPGPWGRIAYDRLHGSPRIYYSSYASDFLASLAARLRAEVDAGRQAWCIFDNTASGAAAANALELRTLLTG